VVHTHANDYAWWHKTLIVIAGAAAGAAFKAATTFFFNQGHPLSLAPKSWTVVKDDSPGLPCGPGSIPAEYLSGDTLVGPPETPPDPMVPDPDPPAAAA
jgi:hypothetical protein